MLGYDTVVGERVRDVQSRFRIVMGPMDLDRFGDFLPGRPSLERLRDWVRNYVGSSSIGTSSSSCPRRGAGHPPGREVSWAGRRGWALGERPRTPTI